MGDRVAEYLNLVIMLVATVAVISLGASFMFFGRKMQNMFFDETTSIYSDVGVGPLRDLSVSDPMEIPAAAVLTFLYDNQDYIYDVYDNRDITEKSFKKSGQLNQVKHYNLDGRNTTGEPDATVKFRLAVSYFTSDLNKKCKITAKVNSTYPDYYDIYVHDLDCEKDEYHSGACKVCKKGKQHSDACSYD
jgi:hypothetical protein